MTEKQHGSNRKVSAQPVRLDARPIHRVYVDGFFMDQTAVTNAEFAKFVSANGYITVAERKPSAEDFPGAPPENLVGTRGKGEVSTGTNHLGFRCVMTREGWKRSRGKGENNASL